MTFFDTTDALANGKTRRKHDQFGKPLFFARDTTVAEAERSARPERGHRRIANDFIEQTYKRRHWWHHKRPLE